MLCRRFNVIKSVSARILTPREMMRKSALDLRVPGMQWGKIARILHLGGGKDQVTMPNRILKPAAERT